MGKIEEKVYPMALAEARTLGYEIYDLEFKKEGPDWYLRIFIDKDKGIGVDDCERFSRAFSEVLDREDPISENYILEVSSPGLFRKLSREEHFKKYIGQPVEVKLYKSRNGSRIFTGVLKEYQDGTVIIESETEEFIFEKDWIMHVKLNPEL